MYKSPFSNPLFPIPEDQEYDEQDHWVQSRFGKVNRPRRRSIYQSPMSERPPSPQLEGDRTQVIDIDFNDKDLTEFFYDIKLKHLPQIQSYKKYSKTEEGKKVLEDYVNIYHVTHLKFSHAMYKLCHTALSNIQIFDIMNHIFSLVQKFDVEIVRIANLKPKYADCFSDLFWDVYVGVLIEAIEYNDIVVPDRDRALSILYTLSEYITRKPFKSLRMIRSIHTFLTNEVLLEDLTL